MELRIITRGPFQVMATPPEGWRGSATGLYLHTGNTPWWLVKTPWRWHRCHPHSVGIQGTGYIRNMIMRCPCGSHLQAPLVRGWDPGRDLIWREGRWEQRNSRHDSAPSFVTLM